VAYAVLNRSAMNVSLYQAAAAMNAQARWQEMITQNLSAGFIPGYRKQEMSFAAVQAGLDPTASTSASNYVIPAASPATNFQPGEMRSTNNPLDFAIEGPGFFEVQLPNGTHAYTRDGEFQFNSEGQLVTKQGYLVMGEGGPIQFDPNNATNVTVSATGEISQGDHPKGKLQIVEFSQPQSLQSIGNSCFLANPAVSQPAPAVASLVHQGFIEASNSSPTAQMASLITSMRMFEANQKVLQTQDERMGRVISDLGGTS
jgi:flagellar basal-body rod protein FlgF